MLNALGVWTVLEQNRTIHPVQIRTAGGSHRPVCNTRYIDQKHTIIFYDLHLLLGFSDCSLLELVLPLAGTM